MKHLLLFAALLVGRTAAAQSHPVPLPLPAANPQPTVSTTTMPNTPGVRYQYQMIHPVSDCVWLAPAWHGKFKLEPSHRFLNFDIEGELEVLLMRTVNELLAEGWEFVEIRTESRTTGATQKIEKDPRATDPANPVYVSTTAFNTYSETRYLFRKAL
ncbi:hypothetical protein JAO73_07350 [Hymenobacter sp. BT523]|uniref:hypothetical protein n=1 Tax=Hymenobacter sp. BT523 TaxID=2795725 RepID=UPI0018EAD8C4|nr:hypothetical protein [Hymenobacter sp. BT523]MBJ6108817.1 hypothetical protein [Hymenobacter sp. BT523]